MKRILALFAFLVLSTPTHAQDPHDGVATTVATWISTFDYSGDGGPASAAHVGFANTITIDRFGDIFIGTWDYRIRKIDGSTGIINTIAGYGSEGYSGDGGPGGSAQIGRPTQMCADTAGNIYFSIDHYFIPYDSFVADGSGRIRKVDHTTGIITTIAGCDTLGYFGDGGPATNAHIYPPQALYTDRAGNVYFAGGNRIRKIDATTGIINTIAGDGTAGFSGDGGPATAAQFSGCSSLDGDFMGNLYFFDAGNGRIRKIDTGGIISTYAGNPGGTATEGCMATTAAVYLGGMAVDSVGNIYYSSQTMPRGEIRKISAATGIVNLIHHGDVLTWNDYFTVDDIGNLYLRFQYGGIAKVTGARSGIDTWTVFDSMAHCSLPGNFAFGINGVVTDTPSATDSVTITFDPGDTYYPLGDTFRYTFKLPYSYY
ncbi:MAG: hypothetical protein EBZ77_12815, partial [Chitinophagia bacterium]|nr:hypothetical protein [Chitinophagia bacterium]